MESRLVQIRKDDSLSQWRGKPNVMRDVEMTFCDRLSVSWAGVMLLVYAEGNGFLSTC